MVNKLQDRLQISAAHVDEINALLLDPDNQAMRAFMDVIDRYGTPEEINRKAAKARDLGVAVIDETTYRQLLTAHQKGD